MGCVATTAHLSAEDARCLMTANGEHRFGGVNSLPNTVEWLADNSFLSFSKGQSLHSK